MPLNEAVIKEHSNMKTYGLTATTYVYNFSDISKQQPLAIKQAQNPGVVPGARLGLPFTVPWASPAASPLGQTPGPKPKAKMRGSASHKILISISSTSFRTSWHAAQNFPQCTSPQNRSAIGSSAPLSLNAGRTSRSRSASSGASRCARQNAGRAQPAHGIREEPQRSRCARFG